MLTWVMKMTNKTAATIDDFMEMVQQKPGMLDYLRDENLKSRRNILSEFFKSEDIKNWDLISSTALYAVQEQFGLDLGFCHYFESDPDKRIKDILNGEQVIDYCNRSGEKERTACHGMITFCPYENQE